MKMGMRMRRIVTFVQTQGRASATESNQTMQRAFLVAGRKDQFIFIDGKTFIFFLYGNAHEKDMSFRMSKMTKKNLWQKNWLRELLKDLAHRLEWSQHLWKGSISSTSDSPAYKRRVKLTDMPFFLMKKLSLFPNRLWEASHIVTLTPGLRRSFSCFWQIALNGPSELIRVWNNFAQLLANWIGSSGLQGNWRQQTWAFSANNWCSIQWNLFFVGGYLIAFLTSWMITDDHRALFWVHPLDTTLLLAISWVKYLAFDLLPNLLFSIGTALVQADAPWQGFQKSPPWHQQLPPISSLAIIDHLHNHILLPAVC